MQRTRREKRRETGTERPHRGGTGRGHPRGGGACPLPEENAYLPGFAPESVHMLLQGAYGYFPHHNDESHLDGEIMDDDVWQRRWRRLAAHLASWYATPSGAVGRRFTEILAAE